MANYFGTVKEWSGNSSVYPQFDRLVALPEGFSGTAGVFPFKVSDGRTPANRLPYAPNTTFFNVIFHTDIPSTSGITGPGTTTPGDFVVWTSSDGTTVGDGPSPSDFLEPGDPLTDLSSSPATAGQVPEADGAGGVTWVTPAGGAGITELTGPITAGPGTGSQATTVTPNAIDNTMLALMPADTFKGNNAATPADPSDLTADQASTVLDSAADPFVRTSALPPAGGDVVGPASSTDNNVPQWDGTTGKLLKDGLGTSTGGNDAADGGKVVRFRTNGDIYFSNNGTGSPSVSALSSGAGDGVSANSASGDAVHAVSITGKSIHAISSGSVSTVHANGQGSGIALEVEQNGVFGTDLALFHDGSGLGLKVKSDGGTEWTSATGAQTTATNLPVFGALTKGVVPAAGAVPAATNFLTETGVFAVPAGTGINQLTGDVTAGPGNGSQAATLASVIAAGGPIGSASAVPVITYDAKGRLTTVSTATITPAAIGAPAGSGTCSGTNTGDQTNISGNAATVTTNANLTGPITSVGNATTIADAELAAISGLTSAANKGIQFTGSGTAALIDLNNPGSQSLAATVTITAGGAPTTPNNTYNWVRIGNLVTYQFSLIYGVAGTTVTNVLIAWPSDMPAPFEQSGLTAGSDNLYPLTIRATNGDSGNATNGSTGSLRRNAGDTAYEFNAAIASGTYSNFFIFGSYFTA